jgi:peptidoglycan hydrolase FlgJ
VDFAMALKLDTDLVLDVVRAANPQRAMEARKTLGAAAGFTADLDAGLKAEPARTLSASPATRIPETPGQKFEAYVLQTFIEAMLPKNNEAVFGAGLAGDMWKSMLAEQVAGTLAEDGRLGIANRLLGDFTRNDDKLEPLTGVRDAAASVADTRPADILGGFVANAQRDLIAGIGFDGSRASGITLQKGRRNSNVEHAE